MRRRIGVILAWVVALPGVAGAQVLPVSAEQATALGVTTTPASPAAVVVQASLPATVTLPALDARVAVLPFSGVVTALLAQEGAQVSAGQPLVQVHSAEYLAAVSAADQANARLSELRRRAARDKALVREGIAPARQAQESAAALTAAQAEQNAARALLAGVAPAPGRPGEYRLLAPAAGTAHERGLALGEPVSAGASAFVLLAGDRLWLEAQLPVELIGRLQAGQALRLAAGGGDGQLIAVGEVIDPTSRAALLRGEIPRGAVAVGQSVTIEVLANAPPAAVRVPAAALTQDPAGATLFVATKGGFERRTVKLLGRDGESAVVTGIAADAQVVGSGVAALKALAEKAAAEAQ